MNKIFYNILLLILININMQNCRADDYCANCCPNDYQCDSNCQQWYQDNISPCTNLNPPIPGCESYPEAPSCLQACETLHPFPQCKIGNKQAKLGR